MDIEISLNGKIMKTGASTMREFLDEQGYREAKIATALNGEFVPVTNRALCQLRSGDKIEIVAPQQGG